MSAVADAPEVSPATSEPTPDSQSTFDGDAEIGSFKIEVPDDGKAQSGQDDAIDHAPEGQQNPAETDAGEEADELDADLLARAEKLGFTADDAKAYGSKDVLERTLAAAQLAIDKQASAWARSQLESGGDQHGQQPQQQPSKENAESDAQQANFEKFKIDLDPAEYDEGTLKVLNGINDHYHGLAEKQAAALSEYRQHIELLASELIAIQQSTAQVTGQQQAEDSASFTRDMDTFFNGLGDEFADTFAKGDVNALHPNSPQYTNRMKLVEEMRLLRYADDKANRPRASAADLAQRALRLLHSDKIQSAARKEIKAKVAARQKQSIARPSGLNGKASTGHDKAVAFVNDFLRNRGVDDDDL